MRCGNVVLTSPPGTVADSRRPHHSRDNPPRENTAGGNPDPGMLLPDTAMDASVSSLALLAGSLLLGGSAGLALAAVRRSRSAAELHVTRP